MIYLNQLQFINQGSSNNVISLPELLHLVESVVWLFSASFTSDVSWSLAYYGSPPHLHVKVAFHSSERWSSSPDKRTSVPYPNFPNLMVMYPHCLEVISFGKGRKIFDIRCDHPNLFLMKRKRGLRVVITSANLVLGRG
ncbi:unnamed protein product [Cuscuta campestris]|uniref:HIRAN domain-containing protein n=1 Tax=Cuscuta campestris TaxID=132261 RepID=A0A484M797_9ASTE|nr:unnamed protein product [Cuscuta campestris]